MSDLEVLSRRSPGEGEWVPVCGKRETLLPRNSRMERFLGPHTATLHAVLRIVAGLLFCQHGLPKLFGGFGSRGPAELFSQMGLAGIIEVFGGAAIALGLLTSPVAFLTSGEMAVAYFQAHLPRGFWPDANGGELAVIFCFVFLYFAATGAGKWSLDALRKGRH